MSTKTVYLYDAVSGELNGVYEAQESPLEPGKYIEPINSTELHPPSTLANEVAVFSSGTWSIQPDFRGNTIYDQNTGAAHDVMAIGVIPSGFALTKPANVLLSEARSSQIAALQSSYQAAISAPVSFKNAAGVTSTYAFGATLTPGGANAQTLLTQILSAGAAAWTAGVWFDTTGKAQTMTFADLQGLAAAIEAMETPDEQNLMTKIANVQAATSVEAVQAIVF